MSDTPAPSPSRTDGPLRRAVHKHAPRMRTLEVIAMVIGAILAVAVFSTLGAILKAQDDASRTNEAYQLSHAAVDELQSTSNYLTREAREYVNTSDRTRLDNYLNELSVTDRRGHALETLREQNHADEAVRALEASSNLSNELSKLELYALRLKADADGVQDLPHELEAVEISAEDAALSPEEKSTRATYLLYSEEYNHLKTRIREQAQESSDLLVESLSAQLNHNNVELQGLIWRMNTCIVLLLANLSFVIFVSRFFLLQPMDRYKKNILNDEPLEPSGAQELRLLVAAYNEMYAKNHLVTESLSFGARNDPLTGILNRGSFDRMLTQNKHNSALILVDVDNFKTFNDTYGHEMGDAILIEVAGTLYGSFRSTDYVCRIGGDEFAVIMVNVTPKVRNVIEHKIAKTSSFLRKPDNGLPPATISVGVAFGNDECTDLELFQAADDALYETKRRGRDGYTFANDVGAEEA